MKFKTRYLLLALIAIIVIIVCIINGKSEKENNTIDDNSSIVTKNMEYVTVIENDIKLNTSSKLKATKTIEGIEISDIQLTYKGGITQVLATVKNTNKEKTSVKLINITFIDKKGKELATITGAISPLEPGASDEFNSNATVDLSNAYDFKVTKK